MTRPGDLVSFTWKIDGREETHLFTVLRVEVVNEAMDIHLLECAEFGTMLVHTFLSHEVKRIDT